MTDQTPEMTYRTAVLPGIGRVQVPAQMTDQEVLDQLNAADTPATAPQKAKKKPKNRR